MSSRICVVLLLVLLAVPVSCNKSNRGISAVRAQTPTEQTSPDCVNGQPAQNYVVTVSAVVVEGVQTPSVSPDSVTLCKKAGDTVTWKGNPQGLKFGITFDPKDKPFKSAYFTETDNTSDEITVSADLSKKYKYSVYFTKGGGAIDPGIIIK